MKDDWCATLYQIDAGYFYVVSQLDADGVKHPQITSMITHDLDALRVQANHAMRACRRYWLAFGKTVNELRDEGYGKG